MNCTHCNNSNTLDSQFCKSCGREIQEAVREAARDENTRLIASGYALLGEGRNEEAQLVAQAVLEIDPEAVGAHSLLGMFFEREGDLVSALESYERVVELNPDSALDKIKVTQVRNALIRQSNEPKGNRRLAALAAAATVLIVASGGAIAAVMMNAPEPTKVVAKEPTKTDALLNQGFNDVPKTNPTDNTNPTEQPAAGTAPNIDSAPPESGGTARQNGGGNSRPAYTGPNIQREGGTPTLPDPTKPVTPTAEDPGEWKPLTTGTTVTPSQPPPRNATEDPKPENTNQATGTPNKGEGTIEIKVRTPKNNGSGGAFVEDSEPNSNGAKAAVKSGNEQFLVGRYDGAAKSYERAMKMGGDHGSLGQKLGMSYERSGKKQEALNAYKAAKRNLESKAASDPAAKAKLDAVNLAIKNLGG